MIFLNRWRVSKAYFLSAWTLLTIIPIKTEPRNSHDEALTTFLRQYVKIYLNSFKDFDGPLYRANTNNETESEIVKFVKEKVKSLKPYLQDEAALMAVVEDETRIIESADQIKKSRKPEVDIKDNIHKFKLLREKIKKALKKEHVSNKTKNLVTTTLDEMIAQMIGHQCVWRNGNNSTHSNMVLNLTSRTHPYEQRPSMDSWNKMWEKLREHYLKTQPNYRRSSPFLNEFGGLLSVMSKGLQRPTNRFKIVCQFDDTYDQLRLPDTARAAGAQSVSYKDIAEQTLLVDKMDDKIVCGNYFKICSQELTAFLIDFYNDLNDTTVNTVENYGAMFLRDVNDDAQHEKERVAGLINNSFEATKGNVVKSFKKYTGNLRLDENKNEFSNMKIISTYIAKTINNVKKHIHTTMENCLASVTRKVMQTIQKDIDVNLDVDLGNLERELNNKMCMNFEMCNGKYFGTRKGVYDDKHSVYVQVQLDVDNNKTKNNGQLASLNQDSNGTSQVNGSDYETKRIILTRPSRRFNVTRTIPVASKLILETDRHITKKKKHKAHKKTAPKAKIKDKTKVGANDIRTDVEKKQINKTLAFLRAKEVELDNQAVNKTINNPTQKPEVTDKPKHVIILSKDLLNKYMNDNSTKTTQEDKLVIEESLDNKIYITAIKPNDTSKSKNNEMLLVTPFSVTNMQKDFKDILAYWSTAITIKRSHRITDLLDLLSSNTTEKPVQQKFSSTIKQGFKNDKDTTGISFNSNIIKEDSKSQNKEVIGKLA